MKIRISGNSIRLRLTKSEVSTFAQTGKFQEQTQFPNAVFTYALHKNNEIEHIDAHFSDAKIVIYISANLVEGWDTNNKVGFEYRQQLPDGKELFLLVEKDFVCMDESFEDQSDNYPNPNAR